MKGLGRRGIFLIIFGIIIIVIGGVVIWQLAEQLLTPGEIVITEAPIPTEDVVITRRSVPRGAILTSEDLTLAPVPIDLVPLNRLTDINLALGKISTIPMVAGEMVLPHHLVDQTNVVDRDLAFTLEDDQVLMAFPVLDLMGSLNILKRGDVVDILVSKTQQVETEPLVPTGEEEQVESILFTYEALQRLAITAVVVDYVSGAAPTPVTIPTPGAEAPTPAPPPEPARNQSNPVALMLALSPQDALVLKHLKDSGAVFDFVLRSPTSTLLFETIPVTSDYINDLYNLQIRP